MNAARSRKCGTCGHDPACGFASIYNGRTRKETWYCHADDHSCYDAAARGLSEIPVRADPSFLRDQENRLDPGYPQA